MSTTPTPKKKRQIRAQLHAIAAPHVDDDPHETDEAPTVFALTADQVAFLGGLSFLSAFELAHTPKTAPDVPDAFGATALATIGASSFLGGKSRVASIQELTARHAELTAVAHVLAPITRLVAHNLVATDAALATHAAEVMKLASIKKAANPELLQGVDAVRAWSKKHHPGHGTHAAPVTPPAPPATLPAPSAE